MACPGISSTAGTSSASSRCTKSACCLAARFPSPTYALASACVPSHLTPRAAHACDRCSQDYQRTHHGQRAPQSRRLAWNVQCLCTRIKEDPDAGGRSLVTNLVIAAFFAHCISAVPGKAIYTVCTGRRLRFSKSPLTETSNWTRYLAPWRSFQSSQTCRCRTRRLAPTTEGKMSLCTA